MIIRKAVKEDCVQIMKLINELAVYEKAPEEVTVSLSHFIESGFGEKPVWESFVALSSSPQSGDSMGKVSSSPQSGDNMERVSSSPRSGDSMGRVSSSPRSGEGRGEVGEVGEVIGFALYYIRYSTWKGQRMYLEDLLVTDAMRGKGIGKLLFDKLIEECKLKNYTGLVWQVLDWNEPAINFYKKFDGVKFDGEWINCSIEM